jgi:hypothetical protein
MTEPITILDDGGHHLTVVDYRDEFLCIEATMDSYVGVCFGSKAEAQRVIEAIATFLPNLPDTTEVE